MLLRLDVTNVARVVRKLYEKSKNLEAEVEKLEDAAEEAEEAADKVGDKAADKAKKLGGQLGKLGGGLKNQMMKKLAESQAKLTASTDAGFSLYILLRHLQDFEEQDKGEDLGGNAAQKRVHAVFADDDFKATNAFYSKYVASAEIFNQAGELERVFFRFPPICFTLQEARKEELEWGFDRETPGAQLIQFMKLADELRFEMWHEHRLEGFWLWRFVKARFNLAKNSLFALAMVNNGLLMWRAQYCVDREGRPHIWSSKFCSRNARDAIVNFGGDDSIGDLPPNVNDLFAITRGDNATDWEYWLAFGMQVAVVTIGVLLCISSVRATRLAPNSNSIPPNG